MRPKRLIEYRGTQVECYGDLEEDSNFAIVCEDEQDDNDWIEGNMQTNEPFKTWEEAVDYLNGLGWSPIVEIHAC